MNFHPLHMYSSDLFLMIAWTLSGVIRKLLCCCELTATKQNFRRINIKILKALLNGDSHLNQRWDMKESIQRNETAVCSCCCLICKDSRAFS